jgi:hypothetical protein
MIEPILERGRAMTRQSPFNIPPSQRRPSRPSEKKLRERKSWTGGSHAERTQNPERAATDAFVSPRASGGRHE